ncbi:hypothetical protein [Xylocopilactobacillus apis]|uniref:Uncharacterized protein n=1 Tax=Xylocopilactobacillus apis TaxID=2932183 RepID=A0AAU9CYC1_9LACO|nr:hypothetical protein [Xylocopilactobacillus apis]BDR57441.1 hypothetical protein KIMC2_20030 [Xylocopilactobacillus apis]
MTKRKYSMLNPYMMKKVFANPEHPNIFAGFVKDMAGLNVVNAEFEDPYDQSKPSLKHEYIQAIAELDNGEKCLIRIQSIFKYNIPDEGYLPTYFIRTVKDILDNGAQKENGEFYPIYQINVVSFNLFENDSTAFRVATVNDEILREICDSDQLPSVKFIFLEIKKNL